VKQPDPIRLEWLRFADFSAALLYEMLRFRQAVFVVEQRCAYPDLDCRDQGARHLLAWNGDVLAGCLRLIPFPEEARVAIGRVAVAAEQRHRGYARRLMSEALACCRCDYANHAVTLTGQTYLVPFYAGLGFVVTSEPFDDYGLEHVHMLLRG
jgi:ElaA protein